MDVKNIRKKDEVRLAKELDQERYQEATRIDVSQLEHGISSEEDWLRTNYRKGMHLGNFLREFEKQFGTSMFGSNEYIVLKEYGNETTKVNDKILDFRNYLEVQNIKGTVQKTTRGNYIWYADQETALEKRPYTAEEFYKEFGIPRTASAIVSRRNQIEANGTTAPELPEPTEGLGGLQYHRGYVVWSEEEKEALLEASNESRDMTKWIKAVEAVRGVSRSEGAVLKKLKDLQKFSKIKLTKDELIFALIYQDDDLEQKFQNKFHKKLEKNQFLEYLDHYKNNLE